MGLGSWWKAAVATAASVPVALTAVAVGTAPGQVPALARSGVTTTVGLAPRRPNIVVVMADDMRVDDLRFAPNVRRILGRHGLTFENSFAPYPLCCPDRASFLTGMYPHNHHVFWIAPPSGYRAFNDSATLATSLHRAGYNTGFIGKYLNGYGVDRSKVSGVPSWRYVPRGWTDWHAAIENPGVAGIHGGTYHYFDIAFNANGRVDNRYRGRYQTGVIGDLSVAMAQRFSRRARPFFMYVNYVAPHHGLPFERGDPGTIRTSDGHRRYWPSTARPAWVRGRFNQLIRRGAGMPKDGGPAEPDVSDKVGLFRHLPPFTAAERRALTNTTRQRAEAVFVLDRQVGRLVARLRRTGEWSNTVLMFTSDNGYYLGEHRQPFGKLYAHEPSLRVPFLVTGPGMRSGTRRDDPITAVDVAASILDLANARAPHRADGTTKVPTMLNGDRGWTVPVVTEATHTSTREPRPGFSDARTSIGLRTARYSFTQYRSGQTELYDLATDPLEMRNLGRDPAHHALLVALRAVWRSYKDCAGASCRAAMTGNLAADAAQTRSLTRAYWSAVNAAYGW